MRAPLLAFAVSLLACVEEPGSGTSSSSSGGGGGVSDGGTGLVPVETATLCPKLVNECGQPFTIGSCTQQFGPLRVTQTCSTALRSASCADLDNPSSTVSSTCFPPCSGTLAACNQDGTITLCSSTGATQRADCTASCAVQGTAWTGTCGITFGGRLAAQEQCWCQ